jgi:hypothetical protein
MSGTPTYDSWKNMMRRCLNPKHKTYSCYGGRGITVCERWKTFENFLADMGEKPAGKTLGRINNNEGYEPFNCRWETRQEQNNNTRRLRLFYRHGEIDTLAGWARRLGLSGSTIRDRIRNGWEYRRLFTTKQKAGRTGRVNNASGYPASLKGVIGGLRS